MTYKKCSCAEFGAVDVFQFKSNSVKPFSCIRIKMTATQQRTPSLDVSSYAGWGRKSNQIWTKISYNWQYLLLHPGVPKNIVNLVCVCVCACVCVCVWDFGRKKSNLFSLWWSNIRILYYILYMLYPKICWFGAQKWSILELSVYIYSSCFKMETEIN